MRKRNHVNPKPVPDGDAGAPPPLAPHLVLVSSQAARTPRPGDSLHGIVPGGELNPAATYLAVLEPAGRRSMRSRLQHAAQLLLPASSVGNFPWGSLRFEHVVYVRTRLSFDGASSSTINLTLSALRSVARSARQLGQMDGDTYQSIRDVRGVRATGLPRGRSLTDGELSALFKACAADRTPAGRRDAALIALLSGGGLRREEAARVEISGFDARSSCLRLVGKGQKEAVQPLQPETVRAVEDWVRVRGLRPGALLSPVSWSGRVHAGEELTGHALYFALARRVGQAGIASCTPHDLRRTYLTKLLEHGADLATVKELARHANLSTTVRYDRRGERAKKMAIRMWSPPYRSPRPKRKPRKAKGKRRRRWPS